MWGHRVVGNGDEGVLGSRPLRHDNIARFDRQGIGKELGKHSSLGFLNKHHVSPLK